MGRSLKWLLVAGAIGLAAWASPDMRGQEEKAVPKAPPAPANDDAVAIQQMEQQIGGPFRQLHRTELHFMRIVAQPTKQQYEKIAADGAVAMKAAMRKYAQAMNGRMADGNSHPREQIVEAIAKSVRTTLSPEQAARYQKEIDLRTAARKRVVVLNLVAMMDKSLVLRPDQREKISDLLANNWNDSWNQTQLFLYGGQYYPVMPDVKISPLLSDAQRAVWRGISKGQIGFGMDMDFGQGGDIKDEVWEDERPATKTEPAGGKAPPKAAEKP
jgi:hypothetical protein